MTHAQVQATAKHTVGTHSPQPTGNNNPLNPNEYQFSSGAICFAALMEVLKAYEEMQNDWAKTSIEVTGSRLQSSNQQATATFDSYSADAQQFKFQSYEAIGSAASSSLQVVAGISGFGMTRKASGQVDNMDAVVNEMKTDPTLKSSSFTISDRDMIDGVATPRQELIDKNRAEIMEGSLDYKKLTNGLGSDLGEGVTLKEVLQSSSEKSELVKMRSRIAKAKESAHSNLSAKQNWASTITQTFTATGGGIAQFANSSFKVAESGAMMQKAQASQEQAYAAAASEFGKEISQAVDSGRKQGSDGFTATMGILSTMIQTDTRG